MTDTVREVVAAAVSVINDYASELSPQTRIERMATWIVNNLSLEVRESLAANVSVIYTDADDVFSAVRVGAKVGLGIDGQYTAMTTRSARQLATALFMCAERAEES